MSVSNGISTSLEPTAEPLRVGPPAWQGTAMAVVWFGALEFMIASIQNRIFLAIGGGLAVVVLLTTIIVQISRSRRQDRLPYGALGSLLILTSSMAGIIFAGGLTAATSVVMRQLPAHLMALISAMLVAAWWHHQQRQVLDPLRGRFAAFAMTLVVWSAGYAALSWTVFLGGQVWMMTLIAGAITTLSCAVIWWDAGVPNRTVLLALIPTLLLGLEVWLTAWWLPTATLVGATVGTTLCLLYAQTARHLWLTSWHHGRGRRYMLVGTAVILLSLLTARWV